MRVVGEDEDRRQVAQRRQPHRRTHVVAEDEKGGAEGAQPAVVGEPVGDGAHGVLAHAVEDVAAGGAPVLADGALSIRGCVGRAFEVAPALERGVGRRVQVGAAADKLRERPATALITVSPAARVAILPPAVEGRAGRDPSRRGNSPAWARVNWAARLG